MTKEKHHFSEEHCRKIGNSKRGISRTLEVREKISNTLKKRYLDHPEFRIIDSKRSNEHYHDHPETIIKISKSLTGKIQSQETCNKRNKSLKKVFSEPKYHEIFSERSIKMWEDKGYRDIQIEIRSNISDETRQKLSVCRRGELNYAWKGGITTLYNLIRSCKKYDQWRYAVYERDNFCDWFSGVKGNGNLNAHHIKPFSQILEEHNITTLEQALACEALWDINNGMTMLETSHSAYHSIWG